MIIDSRAEYPAMCYEEARRFFEPKGIRLLCNGINYDGDQYVWYIRYDDRLVGDGYTDEYGEYVSTGSHPEVWGWAYAVSHKTPKGVRLFVTDSRGSARGVLIIHDHNKQWACANIPAAQESYYRRKLRQKAIHTAKVRFADQAIAIIQKMRGIKDDSPISTNHS